MATDERDQATESVTQWLDRVRAVLSPGDELSLSTGERAVLLEIAGVAAHASHRTAAPLTTFLAGVVFGSLPAEARETALRELLARLESGG